MGRCIPTLEQEGYKVFVSASITEAFKNIVAIKPNVILLDWGLRSTNVSKVYTYVTEKLKVPCLVFTDNNNPRTTSSLIKSRIKNTLFPPIGGQGIHRRIQILMRGAVKKAHKRRVRGLGGFGAIKVSGEEVDSETVWELASDEVITIKSDTTWSSEGATGGELAWKGVATVDKNTQLVYFFKGNRKPEFNKALGKWEGFDEKAPILMQQRNISKEMKAVQSGIDADRHVFSMIQKNAATGEFTCVDEDKLEAPPEPQINPNEIESVLKTFGEVPLQPGDEAGVVDDGSITSTPENSPLVASEFPVESTDQLRGSDEIQKEEVKRGPVIYENSPPELEQGKIPREQGSILEKSVKKSIEKMGGRFTAVAQSELGCSQIAALEISSSRFKGYLIIGNEEGTTDSEVVATFYQNVRLELEAVGEKLGELRPVLSVSLDWSVFKSWADSFAELSIPFLGAKSRFLVAFMPFHSFPTYSDEAGKDYLEVKFENWLEENSILTFDLYLHMPLNKKYLLYLKRDSMIEAQTLRKLLKLDIKSIYILPSDKDFFASYCIQRKILKNQKAS
jgi:hypothetical protein